MKGVYVQQNSPYYWIRYYDKLEPVINRRRKSLNTKIEVTPGDRIRAMQKVKLQGTNQLKEFVKGFRSGLNEKYIKQKTGISILRELRLSDGLEEFKKDRSIPGSNKELKGKTLENYTRAVNHFIAAAGDKKVFNYTEDDYNRLLYYFDKFEIPAGEKKFRKMSINSRSIYTRSLSSLWNYFIKKKFVLRNIIEAIQEEEKDPDPIPSDEMYVIIKYFRDQDKDYPHHYWLIYFMLLTGCRPSSAIMQLKKDIDIRRKIITIKNVKSGKRKKKEFYKFPLYNELENLLKEIKPGGSKEERLFYMYSITPENYTWPLSFWKRAMNNLYEDKIISQPYNLKQIRPTFLSFLINILKMDIYKVYKLADHADIKVTDKHYIDYKLNVARQELDEISLEDFK